MKFFSVKAKCGHVGRMNCVWVDFAVVAENAKEAARKARNFARVKHQHKDAIASVQEIGLEEYYLLRGNNETDPFLNCRNKQEQNQIEGLEERIAYDNYNAFENINRRSKNESQEYRSKRRTLIENSLIQAMREYIMCA